MKKRILLVTAIAAISYLTLSSYNNGAALNGQNRSGAKASITSCGTGSCHGTGTGTSVTITVDSGTTATAVTHYVPGQLYTIKIHGTSTSSNTHFGFQFASVSGAGAAQVQAGTSSSLPSHVALHSLSGLSFVEHSAVLAATSAGVYDITFNWTAPATGIGNITLYCTLNAVNGDDIDNAADISGNTSVVLGQEATTTSVAAMSNDISVKAFPNPATTNVNVQLDHAQAGAYSLQVFDLNGRTVTHENITVTDASQTTSINTATWASGMFFIVLQKEGFSKTISVVKN